MFELKRVDCEKCEKNYFLVIDGNFDENEIPYEVHGILRVDNNMKSPRDVLTKEFSKEANKYLYELQDLAYSEVFR